MEAGKGHPIVASYYSVVLTPSENKNEKEPFKTEEEIALSAENNDKSNDSIITTTIQPEKATIVGPNMATADDDKELELDKKKGKNKEEVESSGEEDEDGSPDELNSKNKSTNNDKQQEFYFKTGPEKATNMEANTVPPCVGVPLSERNNMEDFDKNVVEKSKKEKSEESTMNKNNINTKTEEATNMEADTEAIGIETQLGLLNHVVGFHVNEVVTSKCMEEETNKVKELESMS